MTEAPASVLEAAEALSIEDQEILWICLEERLGFTDPPELNEEQWAEIERREAEVERGEVQLIPGEEVDAHVRAIVEAARLRG